MRRTVSCFGFRGSDQLVEPQVRMGDRGFRVVSPEGQFSPEANESSKGRQSGLCPPKYVRVPIGLWQKLEHQSSESPFFRTPWLAGFAGEYLLEPYRRNGSPQREGGDLFCWVRGVTDEFGVCLLGLTQHQPRKNDSLIDSGVFLLRGCGFVRRGSISTWRRTSLRVREREIERECLRGCQGRRGSHISRGSPA